MAKVNFNNLEDDAFNSGATNNSGSDVGFFTLKNDNDEAVVRFICDSTDDFEILTVHDIQLGQRYRKVNCIRDPHDPLDNCPLCKSGARINNRFFIKLIQYDKVLDPTNNVTKVIPKAMVWERSTQYAKTLKSYIDNYGPLSDVICKIIRHGKAGDMQTTYEIVPNLSKNVYPDNVYVKDTTLFGSFEAFGTIVMNKTADEMNYFIVNGEFPAKAAPVNESPATPDTNQGYVPPQFNQTAAPQYENYVAPSSEPPQQTVTAPQFTQAAPQQPVQPPVTAPQGGWGQPTPRSNMPWENATGSASGGFERPRRY